MFINRIDLLWGSELQFKKQLPDIRLLLQRLGKQRMPDTSWFLGQKLPLPCDQQIVIPVQNLLCVGKPLTGLCLRVGRVVVIQRNFKIRRQLPGSISDGYAKEPGDESDHIPLRAAAEAVKATAELHAGRVVIVEWAHCHSGSVHPHAIPGSHLPAGKSLLQLWIVTHVPLLCSKFSQDTH